MKRTEKRIPLDSISREWNMRLKEEGSHLIQSILDTGLQTPIVVKPNESGDGYVIIQGHLRTDALRRIKDTYPEKFNALFGTGVPAVIVTGASERELALLHIDGGTIRTLSGSWEIAQCFQRLFGCGVTEAEASNHMAELLNNYRPMKPERAREIEELREAKGPAAAYDAYAEYRRGLTQFFKQIVGCPTQVMDALKYADDGVLPSWAADKEAIPKISKANVKKLYDAHLEDLKVKDERGLPKYTLDDPGPEFLRAWSDAVEATQNKKTETRTKAWSGQMMKDQSNKFVSDGFRALCQVHAGEDIKIAPAQYDQMLKVAETLRENDPEFWKGCVEKANAILAERKAKAEVAVAEQTQKQADAAAEAVSKPAKPKSKKNKSAVSA